MKYEYGITIDVANAQGIFASKYINAAGTGVLTIEGTPEQFDKPEGQTFQVQGMVIRAQDMDGKQLPVGDVAKLHFGPIAYTFKAGAASFSGDNWSATLTLTLADDQKTLQAVVDATGTGLARFAAKNIKVIINGVRK